MAFNTYLILNQTKTPAFRGGGEKEYHLMKLINGRQCYTAGSTANGAGKNQLFVG